MFVVASAPRLWRRLHQIRTLLLALPQQTWRRKRLLPQGVILSVVHWLVPWRLRQRSSRRVGASATLRSALAATYFARCLMGILELTTLSSLFYRGSGDLPLFKLQCRRLQSGFTWALS